MNKEIEILKQISFWINIAAIVFSPIIAVCITIWLTRREEKRKEKVIVLKQLMIARAFPLTYDYVKTVNCIDVIFADNKKVRKAWKELYDEYIRCSDDSTNINQTSLKSKQIKLIEEVANDLGYGNKIKWNDVISNEYFPKWLSNEIQKNSDIQQYQTDMIKKISDFLSFHNNINNNDEKNKNNNSNENK